ncbi:MAG: hypothetical protein K8I82_22290 [Anaerolineae bacterium]|nr:hypothetical protein [Anaerolineae bacterium]
MGIQLTIFFSLMALLPTFMAVNDWRVWFLLWRYGELTDAQIQYHWEGKLGLYTHYYVIFEFETLDENGDPLIQNRYTEIEREDYFLMLEGEPLKVKYARTNPRVFRLEKQPTAHLRWTLGAIVCWLYVGFMVYVS